MSIGTVFVNNRAQAARMPMDVRLPDGVQKVEIRVKGHGRVISPLGRTWDSFFSVVRGERRFSAGVRCTAPAGAGGALVLRYLLDILIALYVLKRRPMAPRPRSITKLFAPPWKKFGQPVCVNDTHIAAHVRSEGLVLVTNNMGEFARVAALEAENWVNASQ